MILTGRQVFQLSGYPFQRFLTAAAAIQEGRQSPASADRGKDLIAGFCFSFELLRNLVKAFSGLLLFCVRHGNAMYGHNIHDARFFRLLL